MGLLLNYAYGILAIFETILFDHREYEVDKNGFSLEVDLKFPSELDELDETIRSPWR